MVLYESENKLIAENTACENKIVSLYVQNWNINLSHCEATTNTRIALDSGISYIDLADQHVYEQLLKLRDKLTKNTMDSFVKARSHKKLRGGRINYVDVPKTKALLFDRLWQLHNAPLQPRLYTSRPIEPSQD